MIVYKATNRQTGDSYIGQTTKSLDERQYQHYKTASKNKSPFAQAICKYGEENFEWTVVKKCDTRDELHEMEKYYITNTDNLYNTHHNTKKVKNNKLSDEYIETFNERFEVYWIGIVEQCPINYEYVIMTVTNGCSETEKMVWHVMHHLRKYNHSWYSDCWNVLIHRKDVKKIIHNIRNDEEFWRMKEDVISYMRDKWDEHIV